MSGAVLCTLNIQHDSAMISAFLKHSEAKVIFVDRVNNTSGTTLRPKGVVFNHRGGYLNATATFMLHEMSSWPIYLWTVPMFHCNGWCLVWGLAALGGTSICLRQVSPKLIFERIAEHKVTHMGGAPTVLNMIVNSPVSDKKTTSP
ncbi:hypothetical protein P3S67_024445 [Capsicum chacoense]